MNKDFFLSDLKTFVPIKQESFQSLSDFQILKRLNIINDDSNNLYPICYESIKKGRTIKGCKHKFCRKCLNKWIHINSSCPLCRNKI